MGSKPTTLLGTPVESWESVHKCPACGTEISFEQMDLQEATTGIVPCTNPECGWSGQIKIEIVPRIAAVQQEELRPVAKRPRRRVKSMPPEMRLPCSSASS